MKKYKIIKKPTRQDVMYEEKLLGFSFPITRSTA